MYSKEHLEAAVAKSQAVKEIRIYGVTHFAFLKCVDSERQE